MNNGYYLSIYASIDNISNIFDNISINHDFNISLWKADNEQVTLIHYWELERLTGKKHHFKSFYDKAHFEHYVEELIGQYGLKINEIQDIWGFSWKEDYNPYIPSIFSKYHIHSITHLFSSLLIDTRIFQSETIIGMAMDHMPDMGVKKADKINKTYYCGCLTTKGQIIDVFDVCSPGPLWAKAKEIFEMEEGTLMALAEGCTSRLLINDDLPIFKYFSFKDVYLETFSNYIHCLCKKIDHLSTDDIGILFTGYDNRFSLYENKVSMIIKVVDEISKKIMDTNIQKVKRNHNIDLSQTFLSLSGGYALNCPTNSYLMHRYKFKGFVASPCTNDSGHSLGIALYHFYQLSPGFNFKLGYPYYGDPASNKINEKHAQEFELHIGSKNPIDMDEWLHDIQQFPVIWFQGRAEIGPRALGNRSILADPRKIEMKDMLNQLKCRQWWRPVAPIIIEEDLNEWFEDAYPSPYMLHTFRLKKNKAELLPAIVHLDGTCRVQTVSKDSNPELYAILCNFKKSTGIPILCNTSLNDKGEPIINTINECFNFALRKGISVVYINLVRYHLIEIEKYIKECPYKRNDPKFFYLSEEKLTQKKEILNPYHLSQKELQYYVDYNGLLFNNLRIDNKKDLDKMRTCLQALQSILMRFVKH